MKFQARLRGAAAPVALSVILAAQPVFAQGQPPVQPAPEESVTPAPAPEPVADASGEDEAIYVTGSRIRRSAFNSPDPITIISPEIAESQGQFTTAQMLQSSPIAAGSAQVTSAVSAVFNTDGGLGAETVSLRGLGSNRTLVLLNGRRAGPSGTRGAVSSFDLNVLPMSIVETIEILKTGASSIYGSDAVAGVVNIKTVQDTDGIELDGFLSKPFESGGEDYRISATWGKDFGGNGHLLATVDWHKNEMLRRQDRDYLACPEEYIFGGRDTGQVDGDGNPIYQPTEERVDIIDPRTGAPRCNDFLWGHVWTYDYDFRQSGLYQYDYDGALARYLQPNPVTHAGTGSTLGLPPGWFRVTDESPRYPLDDDVARTARGLISSYHPFQIKQSVVPETELWTAYVDGAYNVSDTLEIGTELLFNRRKTSYDSYAQFYYLTGYTNDFDGTGFGDPFSPGWSGLFYLSPTAITDHNDSSVEVDYYRAVAWADGQFGDFLSGWSYGGYGQYSRSEGEYTNDIVFKDAVDWHDFRTGSCAGVDFYSGVDCVDINWTDPEFLRGNLSPEEEAFLYGTDVGNTLFDEWIAEFSVSGPLFSLPAGSVQVALGVDGRWDKIVDTPGQVTLDGNVWGASGAGITAGKSQTLEAFGEIEIPLIHDTELIQEFTLSGSGRVTNVKATRASDGLSDSDKGNWTYSVGASWVVTDWLQFRGRYGTSFRYPALYELFLSNQTGFLAQREIDPCIDLVGNDTVNDRVRANCLSGIPGVLPGVPDDHPGAGVEATIVTGGGLGVLEPETSSARTASMILTPFISDDTRLNIAFDYYDIRIAGEIATLGSDNIIYGCYNSEVFPNEPLCSLFNRNTTGAGIYNINTVQSTYINVNSQRSQGLDVTVDVTQDIGRFGELQLLAQMNWQFKDIIELYDGNPQDDNGEVGEPKWVGDFNLIWRPTETWSLFYGLDVIGASSTLQDYVDLFGDACGDFVTYGVMCVDVEVPATFYHSISVTKEFEQFTITGGIANLFDQRPPRVTVDGGNSLNGGVIQTIGQSPLASQYDYYGIRGFVSLKARF
ncbi:MAG TPA: TonB-dependent receptor [Croceibacterium sp.]